MPSLVSRGFHFIHRNIRSLLYSNKYYSWYVVSRNLSNEWKKQLSHCYFYSPNTSSPQAEPPTVISIYNGNNSSGGFADRLKGIISTYQTCKEQGKSYKLLFTSPFPLNLFLEPNEYDWFIKEEDVVFEQPYSKYIALQIGEESLYQSRKQHKLLSKRIAESSATQTHVYTNAMFSYHDDFATHFNQLFTPTPRFQKAIDQQLTLLGNDYISISARFINSLGDFNDTLACEELPAHLKRLLLDKCMQTIRACHQKHPKSRILVNSDSITFLKEAQQLEYVYVIPGTVTHIDAEAEKAVDSKDFLYEKYEKTLLDFFMIANASQVYRIDGKWLHTSGYPYAASRIKHRPFTSLKIDL